MDDMDTQRIRNPRAFLRAIRLARAVVARGGTVTTWWGGAPLDAAGFRQAYQAMLDRWITARGGPQPAWRKLDPDYQRAQLQDCLDIRRHATQRVRIGPRQLRTRELRRRFAHAIADHADGSTTWPSGRSA